MDSVLTSRDSVREALSPHLPFSLSLSLSLSRRLFPFCPMAPGSAHSATVTDFRLGLGVPTHWQSERQIWGGKPELHFHLGIFFHFVAMRRCPGSARAPARGGRGLTGRGRPPGQTSFNTKRYKGRNTASGIDRKSSIICPGATTVVAAAAAASLGPDGPGPTELESQTPACQDPGSGSGGAGRGRPRRRRKAH